MNYTPSYTITSKILLLTNKICEKIVDLAFDDELNVGIKELQNRIKLLWKDMMNGMKLKK